MQGGPHMQMPVMPPDPNDPSLMPKVPYYDLPAGLMAPLVKVCSKRSYFQNYYLDTVKQVNFAGNLISLISREAKIREIKLPAKLYFYSVYSVPNFKFAKLNCSEIVTDC